VSDPRCVEYQKHRRALGPFLLSRGLGIVVVACIFAVGCRLHLQSDPIVVNWDTMHQTIDGFGASATGYVTGFTPQQADQFFSAEKGLGLSLLRIRAIADTKHLDCGCVVNAEPYACVVGEKSQIVSGDLQTAQLAVARGAKVFATPWSPPAEMKTSGKYCSSGEMKEDPANYEKYAGELADYLSLLQKNGLAIMAISVQNEPDLENKDYDTCRWTGKQIHDFIPLLSKAISGAGFESVKIAAPEQSKWAFDLMKETMGDPSAADKVGLIFGHGYDSDDPSGLPAVSGRHFWETEVGEATSFDGGISDGLRWARSIHNYMTIGANAWMYWSLSCAEKHFNHGNNMCLTDQKGDLAKRGYVLGQYAKFVRPGWQRIGVTNNSPLLVTAYRGPANDFVLVIVNENRSPVRDQPFLLNGATSLHHNVAPWITSSSASLAAQSTVPLAADGITLRYTIPGNSVVTFQGKADQN
jgi:glucuronoarabinoxylan endo-1,4-beta-xylanase